MGSLPSEDASQPDLSITRAFAQVSSLHLGVVVDHPRAFAQVLSLQLGVVALCGGVGVVLV